MGMDNMYHLVLDSESEVYALPNSTSDTDSLDDISCSDSSFSHGSASRNGPSLERIVPILEKNMVHAGSDNQVIKHTEWEIVRKKGAKKINKNYLKSSKRSQLFGSTCELERTAKRLADKIERLQGENEDLAQKIMEVAAKNAMILGTNYSTGSSQSTKHPTILLDLITQLRKRVPSTLSTANDLSSPCSSTGQKLPYKLDA